MQYDIIIIGSGPAGYVSAIRAGQLGMKVAIVEKEAVGGMCLNWGCIPSKSMIESAKLYQKILKDALKFGIEGIDKKQLSFNYKKASQRANSIVKRLTKGVEFLLNKNKVEIVIGEAKIVNGNAVSVNNRLLETKNIMISTGAKFEHLHKSLKKEVSVKEFFELSEMPDNVLVFGYDAPSIEITQMLSMIDKNVTLLVPDEKIMPMADDFLVDYMNKILIKNKVKIHTNIDFSNLDINEESVKIGEEEIPYDLIVNLGKRQAVVPKSDIKIELENSFIKTDDNLRTNISSIFAVGDVNGKSRFAHIASAEGLFVINSLNGVKAELEFEKYPLNMYTVPEMAQIGKTEQKLKKEGIDYKISEFSLAANGKALAEGNNEGVIRILSENKYGEVLGVQIVAEHATDLISEASAFLQLESTVYDVAKTVHAHPTISEAFMEAGFEGVDFAIHK
ncbi:MAG: FAD-dependent oxidoreductase [Bacteroidales bacterium]|nr:FAD-dependent oxidoreductase [Bacteroidales bacterium]